MAAVLRGHRRLHADEPLLGRAEDDWVVAAPAVRVRVIDIIAAHQHAAGFQQRDDRLIRLEDGQPVVLRKAILDASRIVDRAGLIESIADTGIEVIRAVRWRSMDSTRTLVGCNVVGVHAKDLAIEEWMLEGGAIKRGAFEARNFFCVAKTTRGLYRVRQSLGGDVDIPVAIFKCQVLKVRVKGNRERCRQRPRSRRPDDREDLFPSEAGIQHIAR